MLDLCFRGSGRMGGESGDGSRSAALVGMVCSGLTVAACLLVVPLIQTRLTAWQEDVALRMAAFKVYRPLRQASLSYCELELESLTDDSWREMMTLRRELRIKRDAETDEDLVDIEGYNSSCHVTIVPFLPFWPTVLLVLLYSGSCLRRSLDPCPSIPRDLQSCWAKGCSG